MYIQRIKEKEKNQVLSDFLWNKLKNSFIELDVCITRLCRYIKKESHVSEKNLSLHFKVFPNLFIRTILRNAVCGYLLSSCAIGEIESHSIS